MKKRKTGTDIMFALAKHVGGSLMADAFRQMVVPKLPPGKPLTDVEFAFALSQIEEEVPAFLPWLSKQTDFACPPLGWLATNN